jgi:hypothetical protein
VVLGTASTIDDRITVAARHHARMTGADGAAVGRVELHAHEYRRRSAPPAQTAEICRGTTPAPRADWASRQERRTGTPAWPAGRAEPHMNAAAFHPRHL